VARASLAHERPVPGEYPKSSPDAGSDGRRPAEDCLESSGSYPVFAETVIQITKRPLKSSSETRKVHVEGVGLGLDRQPMCNTELLEDLGRARVGHLW